MSRVVDVVVELGGTFLHLTDETFDGQIVDEHVENVMRTNCIGEMSDVILRQYELKCCTLVCGSV